MACTCASAITAEMKDWVALGGGNSGCCGNNLHTYGFHREASSVPVTDYSRKHEAAKPYNMSWASAGDFGHGGKAALRAKHAALLARLMAGDPSLHMICEYIGQPWSGKPVYYWARWNGITTLSRYTGSGHDTWSHVSWWRSKANLRANLWTPAGSTPTPESVTPSVTPTTAPAYPGYIIRQNVNKYDANVKTWQARMKQRGWSIDVDGYYGPDMRKVVVAFQKEKKVSADGDIGPVTWALPWTAAVTA